MRLLVAILLCLAVSTANSQQAMRATDGVATTVTLRLEACANDKVLAALRELNRAVVEAGAPPLNPSALRSADVLHKGKPYAACWADMGDRILVIDDAGVPESLFLVPKHHFSPATAI